MKYFIPLFFSLIFIASSVTARPLTAQSNYVFSWSGIRIGKLHLDIQQKAKDYQVEARLSTAGVASLFSDHESVTSVVGVRKGNDYIPQNYRSDYSSKKKEKVIALTYDENGVIKSSTIEPPKRESRPDVPAKMLKYAKDTLTSVLVMRQHIRDAMSDPSVREIIVPAYDGKRRFDLIAHIIDRNSMLEMPNGEALAVIKLGLKRNPIAGYKEKELKKMAKGEPELIFYIDRRNFLLSGLSLPLYGATLKGWLKDSCTNEQCQTKAEEPIADDEAQSPTTMQKPSEG